MKQLVGSFLLGFCAVSGLAVDQPLEYIRGDGVAYVDTGIVLTNTDTLVVECMSERLPNPISTAWQVCGARAGASSKNISVYVGPSSSEVLSYSAYGADFNNSNYEKSRLACSQSLRYDYRVVITNSAAVRAFFCSADSFFDQNATPVNDVFCTSATCRLFDVGGNPSSANKYPGRIYGFKIFRAGEPLMDLRPVLCDGVYGFRDAVSGKLFTNSADAGAFTGFAAPETRDPPDDVAVAYVQGDGQAYVDTGIKLTQDDRVEAVIQCLGQQKTHVFGSRTSATENNFSLGENEGELLLDFKDYSLLGGRVKAPVGTGSNPILEIASSAAERMIRYPSGSIIDESRKAITGDFTTPATCRIFGIDGGWGVFKGRIYGFRIVRGEDVLIDLAPWFKDGVYTFKDRVTGEFFGNAAGSGAFSGPKPSLNEKPDCSYRVDYVENLGYDYVDTGYVLASTDRVELDIMFANGLVEGCVMGCREAASKRNFSAYIYERSTAGASDELFFDFNDSDFALTRESAYVGGSQKARLTVRHGAGERSITKDDGTVVFSSTTEIGDAFETPGSCYLFNMNGAAMSAGLANLRIYGFKVWRGEELKMNLVPFVDKDRGAGFWDEVAGRFVPSASGLLVAGSPTADQLIVVGKGASSPSEGCVTGLAAGDSMVVSAVPYQDGKKFYKPIGWKLYRPYDDPSLWVPIDEGSGASFTYVHPDGYAARLVWQWKESKLGMAVLVK